MTAVLGTHTHIQTNDARILPNGTAFISDVGMCGYYDGILGFDTESVVKKNCLGQMSRFEVPKEGRGIFNGVIIDIDEFTGLSRSIKPIQIIEDK